MGNTTGKPTTFTQFQDKYRSSLISDHHQRSHGEGICHGMCLDWLRAMLYGKGRAFATQSTKDRKGMLLQQENVHKMYKRVIADERGSMEELHGDAARIATRHSTVTAEIHATGTAYNAGRLTLQTRLLDGEDEAVLRAHLTREWRYLDTLKDESGRLEDEQRAIQQRIQSVSDTRKNFHHTFQQFARVYASSTGDTGFDDVCATPRDSITVKDQTALLLDARTELSLLTRTGSGALLNLRRGEGAGHFFAFYRNGENYSLFDPNVGWYTATGDTAIWQIFQDLYDVLYAGYGYNTSMWTTLFTID